MESESNQPESNQPESNQPESNQPSAKQRHGCVTAWLILMIIANSVTALSYIFVGDTIARALPGDISQGMIVLLGVIGLANVAFAFMLLKWNKWGFWGFCGSSVITVIINMSIGLGIGQSVMGLIAIGILYGVFQIKKDNVSAWDNLD